MMRSMHWQEMRYSQLTLNRMLLNSVCTAPGEMAVTLQSDPSNVGAHTDAVQPLLAVQ